MGKNLRIIGVVQGVGYRYNFQQRALELGLSGWVRNRVDGSVEASVSGAPEAIEKMIDWAWSGPDGARVTEVLITDIDEASLKGGGVEILATSSRSMN